MRKLDNTNIYKNIIEKIKAGDENSKKELARFTFLEFKENLLESLQKSKIKISKQEVDGFIYTILCDYIEKAITYENYAQYKANIIKAFESRLVKYKKDKSKNKKDILFDHTDDNLDKNIVVNEGYVDPDDYVLRQEFNEIFRSLILDYLRPQEQTIIIQYFGLDGNGGNTMIELGKKYNLSRERIRQIIEEGLRSIKRKLNILKENKNIKDYADDFRV